MQSKVICVWSADGRLVETFDLISSRPTEEPIDARLHNGHYDLLPRPGPLRGSLLSVGALP